jgi:hypothetical protein
METGLLKQISVHTAEGLAAGPSVCEMKTAIVNMKRQKFQVIDKI